MKKISKKNLRLIMEFLYNEQKLHLANSTDLEIPNITLLADMVMYMKKQYPEVLDLDIVRDKLLFFQKKII